MTPKDAPRCCFWTILIILLVACGTLSPESTQATVPTLTAVVETPTASIDPGVTDSQTVPKTPTIEFVPSENSIPTVLPTMEPTMLPDLLKEAYSVQILDSTNGHSLRRVSGWDYGYEEFEGKTEPYYTDRYQWMDSNHLLLFPKTGVERHPNWDTVLTRPVILNLNTGKVWLPPEQPKEDNRVLNILLPRWSPEAEVLISSEKIMEGGAAQDGVITYTSEGEPVRLYKGKLIDISPSGNKMLIDDSWIDLSSGRIVDFMWSFGTEMQRWLPAWSSDETQVYMCCYFYGDATTGDSYSLTNHDNIFDGKPIDHNFGNTQILHHSHGRWLNDTYVLAEADGFYTYMAGFEYKIPIFDPSARTYRDLKKLVNLPDDAAAEDIAPFQINIAPKGNFLWLHKPPYQNSFLVNLDTFQSQEYPSTVIRWSRNGEYAIIDSKLLDLSSNESKAFPSNMNSCSWHPTESICMSISIDAEQKQTLSLLNAQNMAIQEIALPTQASFTVAIWSPTGDRIALITEDDALWQINYPTLDNVEEIMLPMANVSIYNLTWASDSSHLSFVNGTDIYIVDAGNIP